MTTTTIESDIEKEILDKLAECEKISTGLTNQFQKERIDRIHEILSRNNTTSEVNKKG